MANIDKYLARMISDEASDLHFTSDAIPSIRVLGQIVPMPNSSVLGTQQIESMLLEIISERNRERLDRTEAVSFSYELSAPVRARFRISVYRERKGYSAAIRHIQATPPTLRALGLPPIVPRFTGGHHGIVIVAGPTGAGKSTTLAACVHEINQTRPLHIVTLEDPIEYVHENGKALVHQREIGLHTPSYEEGLIEALRHDPDVLVVGEIRQSEEIRRALIAAETGHLVFTTVHASSAEKVIARLISVFPAEEQAMFRTILAEQIRCIVAQKLVPRRDGKGRIAATEVMVGTGAIANLIREGKTQQIQFTMQTAQKDGNVTMTQALARLVRKRVITLPQALDVANDAEELRRALGSGENRMD